MKTKVWPFLIPVMLGFLFTGCGTPPVNWESRVGNYTYAQAEAEFGKPAKVTTLEDGGIFAEWIRRQNVRNPAPTGLDNAPRVGGVDQPSSPTAYQDVKTEYLDLTFAPNGKLSKSERVYR